MVNLNLSRKYRSKNFDELVGQELSVRILKNTLYLNHFFPVYLFAGQRGCGKTSTARIFACALNCAQLEQFQKDPKNHVIPCLNCDSCLAMKAGNHPDFIEADAASHTGVDNVRNIIDAASLLPVLGNKKIYLIDEAHMLSKAAFNAFLKILEEPPDSVLFILATTDPQKIISTVRSRCFQLLFKPIDQQLLADHLMYVCKQEEIKADRPGLEYIAMHAEGSVRDALNVLEQVRFSSSVVNKEAVIAVLGHCDQSIITQLIEYCLSGDSKAIITLWQERNMDTVNAESLWSSCVSFLEYLMYSSLGVEQKEYKAEYAMLSCSLEQSMALLALFYSHEPLFRKTRNQHVLLQHMLLSFCQQKTTQQPSSSKGPTQSPTVESVLPKKAIVPPSNDLWGACIQEIEQLDDPLFVSVFKQAVCEKIDQGTGTIILTFNEQYRFFEDIIIKGESTWKSCFSKVVGKEVQVEVNFTDTAPLKKKNVQDKISSITPKITQPPSRPAPANTNNQSRWKKSYPKPPVIKEERVDVSDSAQWPQATLIMNVFPGTVTKINES